MFWRPIDTAPKDGTKVILLTEDVNGEVVAIQGAWVQRDARWEVVVLDHHGCGCCGGCGTDPTHWMPLPK